MTVSVSIPGKLMLSGEYAVLDGGVCLSSTLKEAMVVEVSGLDGGFVVESDLWPEALRFGSEREMESEEPAIAALAHGARKFGLLGAKLRITSSFGVACGFGSSSAVRLGVLLGLGALAKGSLLTLAEIEQVTSDAILLQRRHQKRASGYDFITQSRGGLLRIDFAGHEPRVSRLTEGFGGIEEYFHPVIGGRGDVTCQSMQKTYDFIRERIGISCFGEAMASLTLAIESFLAGRGALRDVFYHNGILQEMLFSSPNYPRGLFGELSLMAGFGKDWSVKTTGAGGEDALLLIGEREKLVPVFSFLAEKGWLPLLSGFSKDGAKMRFLGERYE